MHGSAEVDTVEPPTESRPDDRGSPRWRSPKLLAGIGLVGFFALVGILGPLFVSDPDKISNEVMRPPSSGYLLGTTQSGQDVFAQLLVATRGSLLIGLIVGVLATVLSVVVGVVGGYLGGWIDDVLSVFSNVVLVIPGLPLVIVITSYLRGGDVLTIALIITITSWAASARVLRAQTLSLRTLDYVAAAKASGERAWRIIFVEILPNLVPVIASQFVFAIVFAILTEAGLSFLGLGGIDYLTWGNMLYFAQNAQALALGAWWWFVPPGLSIALVGCGLSLINFSIDEVINPRLRVARKNGRAS